MSLAGGATLDLASSSPILSSLTGSGAVTTSTGSTVALTLNSATSYSFDGTTVVPNVGGITLTKLGGGSVAFTVSHALNSINADGGTLAFTGTSATVTAAGTSTITTGGALRIDGGNVTLQNVLIPNLTGGDGSRFIISGGVVSMQNYSGGRSGGTTNPDTTTGIQMSGGVVTANQVQLSTTNSWSTLNISGGSFTIGNSGSTDAFVLGIGSNGGRGGVLIESAGSLTYLGTDGLIMVDANLLTLGIATFSGGSATFNAINVNNSNAVDGTVGTGAIGTLAMAGGTVFLGAGGITSATNTVTGFNLNTGSTVITQTAQVLLNSGTLGATADWSARTQDSQNIPMTLGGNINLLAADANGVGHNITIAGNLSGSGGLTKWGAGTVTLSGSNSYTGITASAAGNLVLTNDGINNAHTPVLTSGADVSGGNLYLDYLGNAANDPAALDPTGFMAKFVSGLIHTSKGFQYGAVYIDDTVNGKVKIFADYRGDSNLDASVNTSDFMVLSNHFGQTTTGLWTTGDYNYDGVVNALDFNLVATNFGAPPITPPAAPVLGTLVPGPGSIAVLAIAAGGLLGRRRRK
jgi:hypothetical protein